MRRLFLAVLLTAIFSANAQEDEKMAVQKTIEAFFKGFHAQDSMQIKATVADGIIMQRVDQKEDGTAAHRTGDFKKFLKGIVGIAKDRKFEEKIGPYRIQVDGAMAHVWTDYEFWIDGALHHCGVNSFQLFNDGAGWKIIYLIDTGRKQGCG